MTTAKKNPPLVHGGQLTKVAAQYERPLEEWIDLSTGISPFSYPVAAIPGHIWRELPTVGPGLLRAAQNYYQAQHCLICNGSQQIIEMLPALWLSQQQKPAATLTVYLPDVGYKEHQRAWQLAGFKLVFYRDVLPVDIPAYSVVVVINPNNPSGKLWQRQQLLKMQAEISQKHGLLVVDEAFMDVVSPCQSIIADAQHNTIVLRSFGKFFGLAGIRIGFICALDDWHQRIKSRLGPWQVNGPALHIAEQALMDSHWQAQQVSRLDKQRQALSGLLKSWGFDSQAGCALFITALCEDAPQLYHALCRQGIYVRLTDEKNALRFGIPTDEQLVELKARLAHIKR